MRFEALFNDWSKRHLTQEEAACLLGVSERTFRRYCRAYEAKGAEGLYDKRLERYAHNAAPVDEVMRLLTLFKTKYVNFSTAHFYDLYKEAHAGVRSYNWVRKTLQSHGLVQPFKQRGKHRRKRPRSPMAGMMLHQDGSTHEWIAGHQWDLIVTMDDATNEIYSGFFVEEEGTQSSFQGVQAVIEKRGLFCSLYTDRGSHYWHTPKAGGRVDKAQLTQFGRAMNQLGIEMIPAYSPEARGRSERVFGTLQQRLPKELVLNGIKTLEEANHFLQTVYWPRHNKRFAVKPVDKRSAFVPWFSSTHQLNDILCLQEKRTVNKDNTVSYKNKQLQIPKHQDRCHFIKAKVRVHEYTDGTHAIFYGPRCLGYYDAVGRLLTEELAQAA